MKITMDMSNYEIERDEIKSVEYGAGTLNTVGYPACEPVCGLQLIESTAGVTPAVVSALALRKMHFCR